MCTRGECNRLVGQYVRFKSPYGYHEGVIEGLRGNQAVVLSPQKFIPANLAVSKEVEKDDEKRLDLALAWGGYAGGYGGRGGYGGGRGGWGYGWGRWAVSFLVIYALWGLFW